jgi:copper transport protein
MRRWVPAAAAFVLVLIAAVPAGAHAALLASTPAAGYSVSRSPAALTLVFDERVSLPAVPLHVSGARGVVALGAARLSNGGRWLTVAVGRHLDAGQYRVSWQVVAEDGDVVGGDYTFEIGVPAVATAGHTVTRGMIWASILRWLLFAALSVALGGQAGQRIARRVTRKAAAAGARLAPVDARVALACAVGALASGGLAVHVVGSVVRLSLPALWASGAGRVSVVEVVAFAVAAVLAARRRLATWAVAPLLVVVAAEGRRSHPSEIDGGLGAALLAVHLAAAAIWLGALSHVIAVAWRWRANRAAAHRVLAEYGRLALGLLLLVAATGAMSAVVALVSASALTATGYGRLLLVKVALVVAVVGCAIAGRHRLRLTSPLRPDRAAGTPSGRAVRSERVLLDGVLGVTGLLVSVAVPAAPGAAALAFPPPRSGPVVRLATLDGEVTWASPPATANSRSGPACPTRAVTAAAHPSTSEHNSARVASRCGDAGRAASSALPSGCAAPTRWPSRRRRGRGRAARRTSGCRGRPRPMPACCAGWSPPCGRRRW